MEHVAKRCPFKLVLAVASAGSSGSDFAALQRLAMVGDSHVLPTNDWTFDGVSQQVSDILGL